MISIYTLYVGLAVDSWSVGRYSLHIPNANDLKAEEPLVPPRRRATPQTEPSRHYVHEGVSRVAENYLLSLLELHEDGAWPTPAQLAERIRLLPEEEDVGSSLPSVLGMVRRMTKEGLVEMSPEKRVRLTERGQVLAESVVRRHRLAERMVVDLLGLEMPKAHVEAHRLEHAMSPEVEARIQERLGNPTTSPFGRPIPGSGYTVPDGRRLTMDKGEAGRTYLVERVPEEEQELLRFLVEHDVVPGQKVTIMETGHYRGVITFHSPRGEAALGLQAASRVWLREAP